MAVQGQEWRKQVGGWMEENIQREEEAERGRIASSVICETS